MFICPAEIKAEYEIVKMSEDKLLDGSMGTVTK